MPFMASVALPVLPGKAERLKNIGGEIAQHQEEWNRLCREAGQFRFYNITLQEGPTGDLCIYSMVLDDPSKVRARFGTSPYDQWWLAFAKDVHGVDLNAVSGAPQSVFSWEAA